jgi:uncharacterized membrane protein
MPCTGADAEQTAGVVSTSRLEAFSDGVFAIAMTLLVIEIRSPAQGDGESLAHALFQQWPHYVGYALSFLVLGVMWLNHHRLFQAVEAVDGLLLVLNLNLLLWAVLIPFPTAVVAEHLREGGPDAKTAVGLYGVVIFLTACSFTALFVGLTRRSMLGDGYVAATVRAARLRFGVGVLVYGVAVALSWVSPVAALVAHAAMASYYLRDQPSQAPERAATR